MDNVEPLQAQPTFDMAKIGKIVEAGRKLEMIVVPILLILFLRVLVTTAPDDTTNPPEMQEWFAAQIPGSELMKFDPGYGHCHFIIPDAYERALAAIITRNPH